jgi:hypothetical protein
LQDGGYFRIRKRAPIMSAIYRDIEHRHVGQWIISGAPIFDQPTAELLNCPQVVVAGLGALSPRSQICKERLNPAGRQIPDEGCVATVDNSPSSRRDQLDLLRTDLFGFQMTLEIRQMISDRAFSMLVKSIPNACSSALRFLDQFIQHRLRCRLVRRQRYTAFDSVRVPESAPPFPRLRLKLSSRLRVGHRDRLLVQVSHGFPLLFFKLYPFRRQ